MDVLIPARSVHSQELAIPNIPNTNTAGLVLNSKGTGQNDSYWGSSIPNSFAQLSLIAYVDNRYGTGQASLVSLSNFPTRGGGTFATVSGVGWSGPLAGGYNQVVNVLASFYHLDPANTYSIQGEVDIVQIAGTNSWQRSWSETITGVTSYDTSSLDWESGGLSSYGTDLSEPPYGSGYTVNSAAGLQYAVMVVLGING